MIQAMKHCVVGKLPAGLTDDHVEFFAKGDEVFAIVQSQLLPMRDWPQWLMDAVEEDMARHPRAIEALVQADIVGRMEMIEQYIKCRFSALDNEPDVISGKLQSPEYTDCSLRGSCPYEGRLCELLKAPFGTLTHREIEVLRLIPEGMLDKEIADQLSISPLTVQVFMKSIREKTGAKNKAELVRFAFLKNLI